MRLSGLVGKEEKEFVYEFTFPERTNDAKDFVEHLWARRKVGYLLDQIRANGEKPELVAEVTALAKKYGITTPYTSWLIVPDAPVPVARGPGGFGGAGPVPEQPGAPAPGRRLAPGAQPVTVEEFARMNQGGQGFYQNRAGWNSRAFDRPAGPGDVEAEAKKGAK